MCSNILGSLNYSFHKANAAVYSLVPYYLSYGFIMFETLKYRVKQCHLQWSRLLITFLLYLWAASLAYIILKIFTQSHENCWNCALPLVYKVHFLIGTSQKQIDFLEGNRLLLKNYQGFCHLAYPYPVDLIYRFHEKYSIITLIYRPSSIQFL